MTVSATTGATTGSSSNSGFGMGIGEQKEMFLQLLVAQLKNQDPTSPMDQKDMMGQMAQFSSVEQMANMASTLEAMQANATFGQSVALIGKTVDYLDSEGHLVQDGQVTAVAMAGAESRLVLGDGTEIGVADVVMVK